MRSVTVVLALTAAILLAQTTSKKRSRTRPRGDTDGGPVLLGPDPPGRLKPDPPAARDGGIADGGLSAPDGGARSLQQLQIDELRARIAVLEQQAAMMQQQTQQMAQMNEQLQALRRQLAADSERREDERRETQQQRAAVQSAISSLSDAQARLMAGDTSIGAALDEASRAFSGQAQRDVQAARYYLAQAVSDAQSGK